MAEYMSITSEPGSDGVLLPAVPLPGQFQGYLYRWCRVLAGGGLSQFAGILMRGPLLDVNGTNLTKNKFVSNATGSNNPIVYAAGGEIIKVNVNGSKTVREVGQLGQPTPPEDMGCVNQTGFTVNAVARVTLAITFAAIAAAPSTVNIWIYQNGVQTVLFTPQFSAVAPNVLYIVTGDFLVENWLTNTTIDVRVQSSSAATMVVPDSSLVVDVL